MSEIADSLKLQNTTLHSAAYILDKVVSSQSKLNLNTLEVLALVSLFISAKSFEADNDIPKAWDILKH